MQDVMIEAGDNVQIGRGFRGLDVPMPEGAPYLAFVEWTSPSTARVLDGRGQQFVLTPNDHVDVQVGPVEIALRMVPQFRLRRTEQIAWGGSLAWLAAFMAFSLLAEQGMVMWQLKCGWGPPVVERAVAMGVVPRVMAGRIAGRYFSECYPDQADDGGLGVDVTAEYLARLLKKDYAGDQDGSITRAERPTDAKDTKSFYLPAGNEGPITQMGGAAEVAPEPVRTVPDEDALDEAPKPKKKDSGSLAVPDVGTPVPLMVANNDGLADASNDEPEDLARDEDGTEAPAEEKLGWGLTDWYDARDRAIDEVEVEMMMRHAKRRLAINPDDIDALSILSYYQYLASDYSAAERTYNKYILLLPDASAGYNNKALVYKRRKKYKQEEALYRVALAMEPDDVTALNNLAVCLGHQKRYDEALAILKRLEELDPDDPYADLHRAKVHADMGDDEGAFDYLEQALHGMAELDTLHHIEFRQDIRIDPSFERIRGTARFREILLRYYGHDTPLQE